MDDRDQLIESLKKENTYLKELLKQHNIPYEIEKDIPHHNLSTDEKIKALMSYFVCRDDIFAFERYTKDGKRMFLPACKSRPNLTGYCPNKCNECNNKQYVGITEKEIKRHLQGKDTFGIYPLLKDDLTGLLAVDFDDDDFKEAAVSFSKTCRHNGLDNVIEISSSGSGAHVWLFFEKPIKASKARRLGSYLLYETMDNSKGLNFDSLDRMFPSQDFVPHNGYGNLIVLPLQYEKAKTGKTLFVDSDFVPYDIKKQIDVLLSIKKIKEEEVDVLLNSYKESDYFPIVSKNVLKGIKLTKDDFAKEIVIIKQNEIIVPKAALNDRSIKFIYRLASLPNPKYYDAQRQRRSVYSINRIQRLYHEDESYVYLPRGSYEDLIKVLNFFDIKIDLIDKQTAGSIIPVSFKGKLKDIQEHGLNKLLEYENGLFVAPPAFGKTVTAIALISELKLNALIVVPSIALLNQWLERLNAFLEVGYEYKKEKDKFGQYCGSKKKLTGFIDIASIDSLHSEDGHDLLKRYGLVILDEVHHFAANSYEEVVRECNSKFLFGFTATPKRSDKNEKIVYKIIGDIRYQFKEKENSLEKVLIPEFSFFTFSSLEKTLPYSDMLTTLLNDEERNSIIANKIRKAYKEKRSILVLTDRIEHIKILQNKLEDLENVLIINGQLSAKDKSEFYHKLETIEKGFVILSIGRYIGEGFDEKKLDTLFLVSPFRWNGTLEQYVGRLHRENKDKQAVVVHDFIDINVRMFESMYHERLRGYKKLGYILNGDDLSFEKKIYGSFDYRNKMLEDLKESNGDLILIINDCDLGFVAEILDYGKRIKVFTSMEQLIIKHQNIIEQNTTSLEINALIIDNKIIWYGGINPFKNIVYDDSIMRINDKAITEKFIKEIKD